MTRLRAYALAALLAPIASHAPAQVAGDVVTATGHYEDTFFGAGETVRVTARIDDDAFLAGRDVFVDGQIADDVIAAGENVQIGGTLGDDAILAGRSVALSAEIGGDAIVAGETVVIRPEARVGGDARLTGATVNVAGQIAGSMQIAAREAILSGNVAGDVEFWGERLEIAPGARIGGALRHQGPTPPIVADDAVVTGGIATQIDEDVGGGWPGQVAAWVGYLGLLAFGAVLAAALPGFSARAATTGRERFGFSLLIGLAMLVGLPILAVLCLVTVIGAPLGIVLFLLYFALLPVGYVAAGFALGDAGARRLSFDLDSTGRRVLVYAAALAVLLLLAALPFVGWLVSLAALLIGLGAATIAFVRLLRGAPPARA